jgi:hypothetical protein
MVACKKMKRAGKIPIRLPVCLDRPPGRSYRCGLVGAGPESDSIGAFQAHRADGTFDAIRRD